MSFHPRENIWDHQGQLDGIKRTQNKIYDKSFNNVWFYDYMVIDWLLDWLNAGFIDGFIDRIHE